ncbi:MAG: M12 family metallo-peptidase, partial [Aureliella sp.]
MSQRASNPTKKRRGLQLELLENRYALSADSLGLGLLAETAIDGHLYEAEFSNRDESGYELHALPPSPADPVNPQDTLATSPPVNLTNTFLLNSNPGANHRIYLDFDGHTTSGTNWNTYFNGGQNIVSPAFDIDGNANSFSNAELERIQWIWERVSEDFMPFDVNVTTQDPGSAALIKSGSSDSEWGIRVVIGGSSQDWYGAAAGGVGYVGSFNWNTDSPVFVFPAQLGNGAEKYTAEAISHETGHALGLSHDGRTSPTEEYYAGQGSGTTGWAPIMGASYYQNVTQWSKGEYANASQTQDDLTIITTQNGFGYRPDDRGNTQSTASSLATSNGVISDWGIIETTTDVDVFSF